jgi:hypothetical protein
MYLLMYKVYFSNKHIIKMLLLKTKPYYTEHNVNPILFKGLTSRFIAIIYQTFMKQRKLRSHSKLQYAQSIYLCNMLFKMCTILLQLL